MKNFICFLFSIIGFTAFAQNDIPLIASEFFARQIQLYPQEKIYVQTDKPYYVSGEKIWFCAHVVDAAEHIPITVSRYVYVELIDPLNTVLVRQKIRHDSISYSGHLQIPENVPEGIYELRAYTRYMEGFGEDYFFGKTVTIYHPQSRNFTLNNEFEHDASDKVSSVFNFKQTNSDEAIKPENVSVTFKGKKFNLRPKDDGSSGITVTCTPDERNRFILVESELNKLKYSKYVYVPDGNERFDISFYPEGGNLLEGIPGQVSFKAMKSNGNSIMVTGKVYDDLWNEKTTFNTQHNGMGRFMLTGEAGRSYHVLASFNEGEPERF